MKRCGVFFLVFVGVFVFAVVQTHVIIAAEVTPVPTTKPTDIPLISSSKKLTPEQELAQAKRAVTDLIRQSHTALTAGETQAALSTLLDCKLIYDRVLKNKADPDTMNDQVTFLHGLALAYQLVDRPDRASPLFQANSPLDRACGSKTASRQLLVTRAVLDCTQGYLVMRTAVRLTDYLRDNADELDNEVMDLAYTALVKAEEKVTNRKLSLEPAIKLYEDLNSRLEATRPKEHRWGVKWVTDDEFKKIQQDRETATKAFDEAVAQFEAASRNVEDAEARLETAKHNASSGSQTEGYSRALAAAKSQAAVARSHAAEMHAKIPAPAVLTAADLKKILTPHDAVVSGKNASKTTLADGSTANNVRPFQLAANNAKPIAKPVTPIASNLPDRPNPAKPVESPQPAAQPEKPIVRNFTRTGCGIPVGPDLILTVSSVVKNANRIVIEIPDTVPIFATVVQEADDLALLRVEKMKLPYANLAQTAVSGPVECRGFPEVNLFTAAAQTLRGTCITTKDGQLVVALAKHPRLSGSPIFDAKGNLAGLVVAGRDDAIEKLPGVSVQKISAFLSAHAPQTPYNGATAPSAVQITSVFDR